MLPPRIDRAAVRSRIGDYKDTVSEEKRAAIYTDLIGFIPPRIEARLNVTGALDPKMIALQEEMREHGM